MSYEHIIVFLGLWKLGKRGRDDRPEAGLLKDW